MVLCLLFSSRSPKIKLFPTESSWVFLPLGKLQDVSFCYSCSVFYVLIAMPLNPSSISA